jgi:hypothetical protein
LESAVAEIPGAKPVTEIDKRSAEWEEALARVQAYLSAWRLDAGEAHDWAREIVRLARRQPVPKGSELEMAIAEADIFLKGRFEQVGGEDVEQRLMVGATVNQTFDFGNREQIANILREGALNLARARTPSRPPETLPMTMKTSLSRLPSIQLIAGWVVLIGLLFLTFLLTHR